MTRKSPNKTKSRLSGATVGRPRRAHLEKLIAEAIVDCYDKSEQAVGLFTMMEDNLALPFTTTILGMQVSVEKIDIDDSNTIVAVCSLGRARQSVRILDIHLPDPPPAGAEWIDAYRLWLNAGPF